MIFKKTIKRPEYDSDKQTPVIRCSICTGEKTAGFKDNTTGQITEVMPIRSPQDIEIFKSRYGIEGKIKNVY